MAPGREPLHGPGEGLAVRESAVWCQGGPGSWVRVSGSGALARLDRALSTDLFVRDRQLRAALVLDSSGAPSADVIVGRDDDAFLVGIEGMTAGEFETLLDEVGPANAPLELLSFAEDHEALSVHGPWAWEIVARLLGPEILGLPYLSFAILNGVTCFRAGKTGEFGYELLVPRPRLSGILDQLHALGETYDLRTIGLAGLDQCALENGFFNIRREGARVRSAIELQLQWRLSSRKDFRGASASRRERDAGPSRRITTLVCESPLEEGDQVRLGGREVGEVVNSGPSPARGDHVALALLALPWAAPGIRAFEVDTAAGVCRAMSVSQPVVNNRSLSVSPQLHSYATRSEIPFAPLVPLHAPRVLPDGR